MTGERRIRIEDLLNPLLSEAEETVESENPAETPSGKYSALQYQWYQEAPILLDTDSCTSGNIGIRYPVTDSLKIKSSKPSLWIGQPGSKKVDLTLHNRPCTGFLRMAWDLNEAFA
jgi:hypothetical protein